LQAEERGFEDFEAVGGIGTGARGGRRWDWIEAGGYGVDSERGFQ